MMIEDLKHIIESLLFVSDAPLSVQKIQTVLDLRRRDVIAEALKQLNEEYETRKGGFYLAEAAGGFQLRSRPENKDWIQRLLQSGPARLSKAAMETLAIVAYKQPIIRSDVEYIRGVDCGGVLRVLLERKLVKILGRREIPGRPMIYGTTKKFLEIFGLRDLKDLPLPKEITAPDDADAAGKPKDDPLPEKTENDDAAQTPSDASPEEETENGFEDFDDSEDLLEIDDMLKAVKPKVKASFELDNAAETARTDTEKSAADVNDAPEDGAAEETAPLHKIDAPSDAAEPEENPIPAERKETEEEAEVKDPQGKNETGDENARKDNGHPQQKNKENGE